jgi:hypothetical protein
MATAVLQICCYWSVVTRFIMFLIPPMVFAAAAHFEQAWPSAKIKRLYVFSLLGILTVTLPLAKVDTDYAAAQKNISHFMTEKYLSQNRMVWFSGHWGLQHYMEAAGAVGLDSSRGGWGEVKPRDAVLVPTINTQVIPADRKILAQVGEFQVAEPIPLRLMGDGSTSEAAFYSSAWGFLPYAFSLAPLEIFTIVEPVAPAGLSQEFKAN